MFGYIVMNKPEIKFKDFDLYRSFYCGLCRELKSKYGISGQISLTYDMTFVVILLSALYEPHTQKGSTRCIIHPVCKQPVRRNIVTEYAADMNVLLTYYKCRDDWEDEKKAAALGYAKILQGKNKKLSRHYPEKAAKIRKTEERAKTNLLTKQKYSFDSNGKLANCEKKDPSQCEIFIVEGDSAGGSAKTARNRNYQAILPIRGKILNVEKATIDKVLANAEIKTMINAFGCGFSEGYGNDFDISKLRYDKIVIMADADVDGAHISTLLLTLFYRFMPELIYEGHVYIAMPPLYKAMPKKGPEEYLYDDKALEKYRKTHKPGSFTLQRYKGLGEMDAEQLWETTLNPETRRMKRVEIEDARLASSVTEVLMGSEVPPRKAFIYEHAADAELDV